jgi:PilZ domain
MTHGPADEHRQFTRIHFPKKAKVQTAGRTWTTELLDLSLKGALFETPSGWVGVVGNKADLEVPIADDVTIRMQGEIAHMENNHTGIVCQHIDVDSAAHLRRLVELNLGNDSQLHRELAAMITRP